MRIIAITNNQNYKQSSKPQISKNNMTNTQYQQSFGSFQPFESFAKGGVSLISRLFGLEKKAVNPVAEKVEYAIQGFPDINNLIKNASGEVVEEVTPAKIMNQLRSLWKKSEWNTDCFYNMHLEKIEKNLNSETVSYANSLIPRIRYNGSNCDHSRLSNDAEAMAKLVELYNRNETIRPALEVALKETVKGEPRFSLHCMGSGYGIFPYIKGTALQNDYAIKMMEARALNGGPRFSYDAVKYVAEKITEVNAPALDMLLKQKIKGSDSVNNKKLAEIILKSSTEEYKTTSKQAIVKGKTEYLLGYSGYGVEAFLENFKSPEQFPIFQAILPRATEVGQIAAVLKHYTPEKSNFFEKGLALVDQGQLSMNSFIETLKVAPKNANI